MFPAGVKTPADFQTASQRGNPTELRRWLDSLPTPDYIRIQSVQYDNAGNVTSATDAENNVTTLGYDDEFTVGGPSPGETFAFLTSITNPLSHVTSMEYDYHLGRATTLTDSNDTLTTFIYGTGKLDQGSRTADPLDRLGEAIQDNTVGSDSRAQTLFDYDDSSPNPAVTTRSAQLAWNDAKLVSSTVFDGFGRQVRSHQEEDGTACIATTQNYDGLGRQKQVTNPFRETSCSNSNIAVSGDFTTTAYDALGRATLVTHPDGSTVETDYDTNSTTVTDEADKKRKTVTNALGQLKQVYEAPDTPGVNYLTSYSYDPLGNLTQVSQGSQTRTFVYDSLSRLTSATNPEQVGDTTFLYDDNGNLTFKNDPRSGVDTTITYDALNRATSTTYSGGTPAVHSCCDGADYTGSGCTTAPSIPAAQANNEVGRLTAVGNSESVTNFTDIDDQGRIKASEQITNGKTYSFQYTYNPDGSLKTQTNPSDRVFSYAYDKAGRINDADGDHPSESAKTYASNFSYAPHGAISQVDLGTKLTESMLFNNRLQPTQIKATHTTTGDLLTLGFTYESGAGDNNNGNILTQTITASTFSATQNYLYDALNRLAIATEGVAPSQEDNCPGGVEWCRDYGYDRYGNRAVIDASGLALHTLTPQSLSDYVPATNRFVTGINPNDNAYDVAGNLTRNKLGELLAYDANNRQTTYTSGGATTTYHYDAQGNRVKKSGPSGTSIYVYDAFGKLAAEYKDSGTPTPGTFYRTVDHLGSTRLVTDDAGTEVENTDYLPFGEEIDVSLGDARHNVAAYGESGLLRHKFTGKERDSESGMDYFLARYYSGPMGRFLSVDPGNAGSVSRDPQSWNGYAYVDNNPLLFIDPDGKVKRATLNKFSNAVSRSFFIRSEVGVGLLFKREVKVGNERGAGGEAAANVGITSEIRFGSKLQVGVQSRAAVSGSFGNQSATGRLFEASASIAVETNPGSDEPIKFVPDADFKGTGTSRSVGRTSGDDQSDEVSFAIGDTKLATAVPVTIGGEVGLDRNEVRRAKEAAQELGREIRADIEKLKKFFSGEE